VLGGCFNVNNVVAHALANDDLATPKILYHFAGDVGAIHKQRVSVTCGSDQGVLVACISSHHFGAKFLEHHSFNRELVSSSRIRMNDDESPL
jgi:hypothetical protein